MNANNSQQATNLYAQAQAVYSMGQFDEALKFYDQALKLAPESPRIWYDKGNVLRNWERQLPVPARPRHLEAIECYKRAISLVPDYADAWGNMGICFGASGDHEQALACFTNALEIQPGDRHWSQMKEVALQKLGRK